MIFRKFNDGGTLSRLSASGLWSSGMKIFLARHGFHIPTETFMKRHGARRLVSFVDDQLPSILRYHEGPDRPPGKRTAKPAQKQGETTWP